MRWALAHDQMPITMRSVAIRENIKVAAYPSLLKYYAIDDQQADEYVGDAPTLLKLIYERVKVEVPLVKDPEMQRDLRLRTAHYIFVRIVRLGAFLAKRESRSGIESPEATYRDQLRILLDVDDETFARIFYLARRIARYIYLLGID